MFLIFYIAISFVTQIIAVDHSLLDSYRPKPTALIKSYEKVLKMSLKSLYSEDEREHNITAETILMSKNCTEAYDQFSTDVLNFTGCSLKNARPVHICVECGTEYNETAKSYNNLKQQGKDCQDFFFSNDQVAIIDVIYTEIGKLWTNNYCANCYQYPQLTEDFFEISNALMTCVLNSNKTDFLPANTTCEKCHDLYANMSDKYSAFVKTPGDYEKVCMDVVDTMNITRRMWKEYNCIAPFDSSIGYPNIIVALAIGVTPVLFYLLAKNVSIIEDVKIVRPKRKFNQQPATITVDPPQD